MDRQQLISTGHEEKISKYRDLCKKWRREFHEYPELGWTEYRTTFRIFEILNPLGYQIYMGQEALSSSHRMGLPSTKEQEQAAKQARKAGVPEKVLDLMQGGHTGLVAVFDTQRVGPHIALRFDIDALPIKESEQEEHVPCQLGFQSKYKGVMHACGHDGHTAIGLAVAHYIHERQDELTGKFTLLFQPAEEGSRGAKAMVEKGWLDQVDYFLSGHIGCAAFEVGEIVARTEGFLATTKINVAFKGKAAHAGIEPQSGKNALLAGATAALQLHAIPRHAQGLTRINVGRMNAGTGRNIIPDQCYLELETRGETNELNQYMLKEAKRIIRAAATAYDVEVELQIVGEGIEAASHPELSKLVEEVCKSSPNITKITSFAEIGASEDVCYMLQRVHDQGGQATYLLFGTPLSNGHHHPGFDYQEDVLHIAVDALTRTVERLALKV